MKKLIISFIFILISVTLSSQTNKIKDLESQRKDALRDIQNTTILLNNTKKSTATLLNRISLLSEQMQSRTQIIALLNSEIEAIGEEQVLLERSIKGLVSELKVEQDAYAKAVRSIAIKKQRKSKLLYILSGKSFTESIKRMKYLKDYSAWRSNQAKTVLDKYNELSRKKKLLQETKLAKLELLKTRQSEQLKLEDEEKNHKLEVEEASKKEKELLEIIKKQQSQADNLNSEIQELISEEVARQEREARRLAKEQDRKRRTEEAKKAEIRKTEETKKEDSAKLEAKKVEERKVESIKVKPEIVTSSKSVSEPKRTVADKTYVTKENIKLSSNFASNKGKLPMPISGIYKIVGRFGVHQHNRWKVTTNSNGIDIQAKSGAQAKAVFDGEVSRVVAFPGFNTCIIIRHGGYYTFYGNIKNVTVKQGQKVSAGQNLGTIFTDPDTNNSVLHFQLWKGTNKLNPEPWLRK